MPIMKIKTVNIEDGMPSISEALVKMDRELALARRKGYSLVKLIHGYGSTGAGGDIRIALQSKLRQMTDQGEIQACIFGEDWSVSDQRTWGLLGEHPDLKQDSDLGRRNKGITMVVL
ncbi:MAG TPA: hypothetical protein VEG30_04890 [Terriglobales bacterium]|nr:hypothetical protein [Terriglobales bacterium]